MKIQKNISLASFATLKIGGAAKWFAEAKNEEEITEALEFARKNKLAVFVLGGGSNILVSDKGFEGLAIKISNLKFQISNFSIICDSGCLLGKIVNESLSAGLTGLEWAAGIPGTLGGAVRGNAGAFGGEMSGAVEKVKAIDMKSLKFKTYDSKSCKFEYRSSVFKQNPNLIILSATLKLKKGDKKKSAQKVKEILKARREYQPFDFPSSGSFFKNPVIQDKKLIKEYEIDTGSKAKKNTVPAGYLIDRAGLRGKKIGGAMVSRHHGNFLVNAGQATAEEMIILISVIKNKIRDKFGIQLQEEVQYVGF